MSLSANKTFRNLILEEKEVFYGVTTNDLPRLREVMAPLTLAQRRQLVSIKVEKKTFVYRASEAGFGEIIKYLVVECGADVNCGYATLLGDYIPLFVAIGRADLDTVRTLLKLGADLHWKDLTGVNPIVYACVSGSYIIVKYLKLNGAEINCYTNVTLCAESFDYCKLSAEVGADLDLEDEEGRTALIHAAGYGRHNIVNFLLSLRVDRYKRDKSGLNALCNSIMNDQSLMTKQLLIFAYSTDDYISALELCGANLLLFDTYVTIALEYWTTAVCYRSQSDSGFDDKIPPGYLGAPFSRGEFRSETSVDRLAANKEQRILQVLLVYLRVLSSDHPTTHDAFSYVSVATEIKNDLSLALALNEHLYQMYTDGTCPFLSAAEKAIANTVAIFRMNSDSLDFSDASIIIPHFNKAFDFIRNHVWRELKEGRFSTFNRDRYGIFLSTILEYIGVILDFKLGSEKERKFQRQIKTMGNVYFDRYPTSMLHVAIQMRIPDSVLSYILDCGIEVNFQDEFKCTPLHLALESTFNLFRSRINLLIKAGSHLDIVNDFDSMPLSKLLSIGVTIDPLSDTNLQCITSRVIRRNRISLYREICPNHVRDFVNHH